MSKAKWKYEVLKRTEEKGVIDYFEVHTVYANDGKDFDTLEEDAGPPWALTLDDLRVELNRMFHAVEEAISEPDDVRRYEDIG